MKNFKKLVAMGSAFAVAMSMGVSAFAAQAGTDNATYEQGENSTVVRIGKTDIDATHQWTVIIISADDANKTLAASDLRYINQGTSGDGFWTNMGTDRKLADGNYIVRIGGETITEAGNLIEIPLKIKTTPVGPTYTIGDCDGLKGITVDDAIAICDYLLGLGQLTGDNLLAADCDGIKGITVDDAIAICDYLLGLGQLTAPAAN